MTNTLAIYMPGTFEWIIILLVGLLIFGKKLPELGRGLGKGLVEFKKGLKGVKDELDDVDREVKAVERRAELESDRSARLEKQDRPIGEKTSQKSEVSSGQGSDT